MEMTELCVDMVTSVRTIQLEQRRVLPQKEWMIQICKGKDRHKHERPLCGVTIFILCLVLATGAAGDCTTAFGVWPSSPSNGMWCQAGPKRECVGDIILRQ